VILFAVGLLAAPLLLWRRGSGPHARG